ncbi:MAG TPA: hypothetical protein VMF58_18665 [Rhizomicrobium sp.]|nr:hypothetical protein [Rhizomicrobium sp.]
MKKIAIAAAAAALSVVTLATSASAAIVCNREGECWHVKGRYAYDAGWGLVVHPNNWRWGPREKFVWREPAREERGYWRGGVWVKF